MIVNEDLKKEFLELVESGLPGVQAAKELGVSVRTMERAREKDKKFGKACPRVRSSGTVWVAAVSAAGAAALPAAVSINDATVVPPCCSVVAFSVPLMSGTVTITSGGGDFEIDNLSITSGQEVQLTSFTFTQAQS